MLIEFWNKRFLQLDIELYHFYVTKPKLAISNDGYLAVSKTMHSMKLIVLRKCGSCFGLRKKRYLGPGPLIT